MNKTQIIGKIFFMERHLQNMVLPSMLEQGTMIDNSGQQPSTCVSRMLTLTMRS